MPSIVSGTRTALRVSCDYLAGAATRLRLRLGRPVHLAGAFASREAAIASLPPAARVAYDRDDITEVSVDRMARIVLWDYPVLFWLDRLTRAAEGRLRLLDAGGHVGTKYTAFRDHCDLGRVDWAIWDLPALVAAGRRGQAAGQVPPAIRFVDAPAEAGPLDVLLGSGLMQYIDISLSELVGRCAAPPPVVLLNKVATRDGPELVTIERIGPGRVPYRIRNVAAFEAEIDALGYDIADRWDIPSLGHRIETHPWLGRSTSRGYLLRRRG